MPRAGADVDAPVIIVGAGPVGLLLAGELRLGGAGVTVVERLAAPTTESRASTLHARTMELLDQRGLLDAPTVGPGASEVLHTLGVPPCSGQGHFGGLPLDLSTLPTPYPGLWNVPQARLEALLREWVRGLGAEVRRGHELVGLDAAGEQVRIEVAGPAGRTSMACDYLVGCDGEDSTVRRLAGFPFPGADATREVLHADVAGIDVAPRRFQRYPGGLATAARRADGTTRLMVYDSGRPGQTGTPLTFAEVAAAWAAVTGEDIGGGRPIALHRRGNASRQAAEYRRGRILLAGDAAHRQMPVGGQALNLGLQDAANLGWKLAAQVTGRAPAGLLDTYHEERHRVGARVLANIEAQTLLLLGGQEVDATRRLLTELLAYPAVRAHLGGMLSGLDVRYGNGDGHPLVGARMPPVAGTAAALRTARGVLLDLSGDPARRAGLASIAAAWADRVDLVSAVPGPGERGDRPDTVLLRPDGYVGWAAGGDADPRPGLTRWFGVAGAIRVKQDTFARST
jgi:2-polyprenyl-6-methoxyphenol hydroxylase-like FAD-dependent oxidoreductase